MPKRSSKPPSEPNVAAYRLLALATGASKKEAPKPEKNPAAVALGKLGGAKGGVARAKALTKTERAEIARKAALARWRKNTAQTE